MNTNLTMAAVANIDKGIKETQRPDGNRSWADNTFECPKPYRNDRGHDHRM